MELKPTLLLATALFLICAPEPDSRTIAEVTANFVVPADERALQAAEPDVSTTRSGHAMGQPESGGEDPAAEKTLPAS